LAPFEAWHPSQARNFSAKDAKLPKAAKLSHATTSKSQKIFAPHSRACTSRFTRTRSIAAFKFTKGSGNRVRSGGRHTPERTGRDVHQKGKETDREIHTLPETRHKHHEQRGPA
jgi:hypothetical protein